MFIHFITVAPVILSNSSSVYIVPVNGNLSLTIELSADSTPDDVWQLNGNDISDLTNPTFT